MSSLKNPAPWWGFPAGGLISMSEPATLGELAFPLTTLIAGYLAFHSALSVTQRLGVALLPGTMTVMGLARPGGTPAGAEVPDLEKLTAAAMVTSVPGGRPR